MLFFHSVGRWRGVKLVNCMGTNATGPANNFPTKVVKQTHAGVCKNEHANTPTYTYICNCECVLLNVLFNVVGICRLLQRPCSNRYIF